MGQETCTYMHAYSVPVSPSHVTTEVNTPPANAMPATHLQILKSGNLHAGIEIGISTQYIC